MLDTILIEQYNELYHDLNMITELLHDSYSVHLKNNLHFWATNQTSEITYERLISGIGFVAKMENRIIGTITYYPNCSNNNCEYYKSENVGRFGQFAVDRNLQNKGIGNLLINKIIDVAKNNGKNELALDTSELALDLIKYYEKKGFIRVGQMQWQGVNYKSVILSKKI